jgi:hypothetical protein
MELGQQKPSKQLKPMQNDFYIEQELVINKTILKYQYQLTYPI